MKSYSFCSFVAFFGSFCFVFDVLSLIPMRSSAIYGNTLFTTTFSGAEGRVCLGTNYHYVFVCMVCVMYKDPASCELIMCMYIVRLK